MIGIIEKKIDEANQEIERLYNLIDRDAPIFEHMNLKLHDASYYSYSLLKEDFPTIQYNENDLFYAFAEQFYDMFVEDLMYEHNIDFQREIMQLERTSSFYLTDPHNHLGCDSFEAVSELMHYYFGYPDMIECLLDGDYRYLQKDALSSMRPEALEDLEVELDFIIEGLTGRYQERTNKIRIMYNWITNFKENQVIYFQDFLETYADEQLREDIEGLQEQIESTKRQYAVRSTLREMRTKYKIKAGDYGRFKKLIRESEKWEEA